MISMNARCTKAIDCVWDFARIFLAHIDAPVPKDIALAPIQDHAKVIWELKIALRGVFDTRRDFGTSLSENFLRKFEIFLYFFRQTLRIKNFSKIIKILTFANLLDIDECKDTPNICPRQDDVCTNLRGSHRCIPINCPYGYMRDPDRKKWVIFRN